jgi:hypothetical protein
VSTTYAVNLNGGKSSVISGCTFGDIRRGLFIGTSAANFAITGNVFEGDTYATISDSSSSGTRKVIANNVK